jgi:drug/metabolite transporter (DMT)-like permease
VRGPLWLIRRVTNEGSATQNSRVLPAFLTTVLFSWSVICAGRSSSLVGSAPANFWRLLLAAIALGVWAHGFGGGVAGVALPYFVLSGFVGFGIGDLGLFYALPRLGSRLSLLLVQCLAAPMAAGIEWLWLGTRLNGYQLLCATVILTGVAAALAPDRSTKSAKLNLRTGVPFGLTAAFGQGFGAVLSRKAYAVAALAGEDISGATAAYQRILGGMVIAALAFWFSRRSNQALASSRTETSRRKRWRRAWPWIGLNALAGPILGVTCYQWALKGTPTGIVLSIVATTPLVAIPFTFLIEGDRPRPLALLGGVVAVSGAVALALGR